MTYHFPAWCPQGDGHHKAKDPKLAALQKRAEEMGSHGRQEEVQQQIHDAEIGMTIDEQVAKLQAEYAEWEAGVKDDMGEAEGEAALDSGAWVDGARSVADFAGPEISPQAVTEFLRTHGLEPRRKDYR